MKSFVTLVLALAAAVSAPSVAQSIGDPIGPVVRQQSACFAVNEPMLGQGDSAKKVSRLWNAALRDGFVVGAEGVSARPDIAGSVVYFMYDPKDRMFGMIASAKDEDGARQCNLGVGSDMKLFAVKPADVFEDAPPVSKLTKLCTPLTERLKALEYRLGEVMIARGSRGPNYDAVITMSDNGSWSELLIDVRGRDSNDAREIACFQNWGNAFLLNQTMRAAEK